MARLIEATGEARTLRYKGKRVDFKMRELYKLINCDHFEVVPISGDRQIIFDREAKRKGRWKNAFACAMVETPETHCDRARKR